MIVVDTNILAYLLIEGEFSNLAKSAAEREKWCAPILWRSELRNVLAGSMRRKGMKLEEAERLFQLAEALLWGREFTVRSSTVFHLVAKSNRSAYDCEFLALASDLGVNLLTTDNAIVVDFPETAIHLRDF